MAWLDYCKTFIPQLKDIYFRRMGRPLNIDAPTTFTEKVQWLKIYDSTYIKSVCTDKIKLHEYCKSKLGIDICIPILGIFDDSTQIPFKDLPNGYVIKCNHGSGYNVICKPNSKISQSDIKLKLNKWMKEDFSTRNGCELHYKLIQPKILVEPYMSDGNADLIDYKFYCFNGNVIFCQIITDRFTSEKISHYNLDWVYSPQYDLREFKSVGNLVKPNHYDEMIRLATILSSGFALVRVDFYLINNTIYLGELTFTPNSGYHHFINEQTDIILGQRLQINV